MNTDPQIEKIFTAIQQLRQAGEDGAHKRKLLDTLFRHVHTLKAKASANGLDSLAAAAHEFENVLHSIRTSPLTAGARLFEVQTSFDVAVFDREFQSLKETLSRTGEVISTSPRIDKERPGKVNFRILYARKAEDGETLAELSNTSVITFEEIPQERPALPEKALEHTFAKFAAELDNLPAAPFGGVFQHALQAGRAAAIATGKEVDFETRGSDQDLDPALCDPIIHLVRNAVDHGIETRGRVIVEIARQDDRIAITVTDDGRGIDPSLLAHIFQPGFSTADKVSNISGRGVGLDVVKTTIEELGGSLTVTSKLGEGSSFQILISANPV